MVGLLISYFYYFGVMAVVDFMNWITLFLSYGNWIAMLINRLDFYVDTSGNCSGSFMTCLDLVALMGF